MAENLDAFKTAPEQYLERAKITRWQIKAMSNADVCRQLLDIAERYEELADGDAAAVPLWQQPRRVFFHRV